MGRAGCAETLDQMPLRAGRKVAIDFDSTAWPFHASFGEHPEVPRLNGAKLSRHNWASWDTPVELLMPRYGEDMHNLFGEMARMMDESRTLECMERHGLYPGFSEAVTALQDRGYEPVILTDNTSEGIVAVRTYLASQGLSLEVVVAKMGAPKIEWCQTNDVQVLVDDAPKTILAAYEAGLTPVTIRYLYNAEAIAKTGALHADDWHQLTPLLLSTLGRDALVA